MVWKTRSVVCCLCLVLSLSAGFLPGKTEAATGRGKNAARCEGVVHKVSGGELVLDTAVLKEAHDSMQHVLDCVPPATTILVHLNEIPTGRGLKIKRPLSLVAKDAATRVQCSPLGIEIRSSNVTLQGLRFEGCKTNRIHGLIHLSAVNDVVIDSIVFSGNDNRNGPSCVSGNMSMIKLVNISTIGNIGKGGGFLGMTTSTVTVVDSEFRSNVGFPPLDSEGSTLLLVDCNLTVLDTQFIENKPGNHGGVIMMKEGSMQILRAEFIGNTKGIRKDWDRDSRAIFAHNICSADIMKSAFINNSAMTGGGGLFQNDLSKATSLKINGCVFRNNRASGDGGGVALRGGDHVKMTVNIDDSIFHLNAAQKLGGGVYSLGLLNGTISSSDFEENSATKGGGIFLKGNRNSRTSLKMWTILASKFTANSALRQGGGIFAKDGLNITLYGSDYLSNNARDEGGGVCAMTSLGFEMELNIRASSFQNNTAGPQSIQDESFLSGESNSGGGGLRVSGSGTHLFCNNSRFIGNSAGAGGGILGNMAASLTLTNLHLSKNLAVLGGGIGCRGARSLNLHAGVLTNNLGKQGGALFLQGLDMMYPGRIGQMKRALLNFETSYMLSNNLFSKNEALTAGGALDMSGIYAHCENCQFFSNGIRPNSQELDGNGGGIKIMSNSLLILRDTTISLGYAKHGGAVYVDNAGLVGFNLSMTENSVTDAGSAIAARFSPNFSVGDSALIECHYCMIKGNWASRAGVIYSVMERANELSTAVSRHPASAEAPVEEEDPKPLLRQVFLNNTKMSRNAVNSSGPFLFLADLNDIKICCGETLRCTTGTTFRNSTCKRGDFMRRHMKLFGTFMNSVSIFPDVIEDHFSGDYLAEMNVKLQDVFGNIPPTQATLVFRNLDPNVELSGQPTNGVAISGTSNVTGIRVRARPGTYDIGVEITSKEAGFQTVKKNITIIVRACKVGEISIKNNTECRQCPMNFYSFNASRPTCDTCPENTAQCDGRTLVPLDAYWHNSSHSDVLLPCLNSNACTYPNRTRALTLKALDSLSFGLEWNNSYPLCSEGYGGLLCGSCSEEYGKDSHMDCARCSGKLKMGLFAACNIAVLAGMTVLFMNGAKNYATETLSRGGLLKSQTSFVMARQRPFPLSRSIKTTDKPTNPTPLQQDCSISPADVFKILVNFLQVTTVVTSFRRQWEGVLTKVVQGFDLFSGMTSAAASMSLSCAFQDPSRSIFASFIAASIPFAVWIVFFFFGVFLYLCQKISHEDLTTFWFVSAMALLNISYTGLTQKMVQIFYCVPLELKKGRDWYWAEDTDIECYSIPHRYLAIFAGIPLLLFVTAGFPIALFIKLYRRKDRLPTNIVVSRYGHFYQAYHASFAHWDVFVLARKGLLAIISVLSLTFSNEIKGYAALFVILIAIALHTWYRPYKEQKLNLMEMVSLVISSIVIIFNGIALTPEGSKHLANAVSVINLVLLVSFVMYMMYEIVMASKNTMHNWLKEQDEYSEHRGGVISAVGVCVNIISSRSQEKIITLGQRLKFGSSDSLSKQNSTIQASSIEDGEYYTDE